MLALSLRTTVRMAIAALAAGTIAVVVIIAGAYVLLEKAHDAAEYGERLSTNIGKLNLLTSELLLQRSEPAVHQWRRQFKIIIEQLRAAPGVESRTKELKANIGRGLVSLDRLVEKKALAIPSSAMPDTRPPLEGEDLLPGRVTVQLSEIVSNVLELRALMTAIAEKQRDQMFFVMGAGFLVLIISGGLILILLTNRLLSRILQLQDVIREIEQGNFDADIPVPTSDEMGSVFRQLHQMRLSLLDSMGELSRVNLELVIAKQDLENSVAERTAGLEAANKELEAFTYAVSHDLRAPLRAISGYSRAVIEEYSDQVAPEGQAMLSRIGAAAQRMSQLIDDLLELSQLKKSLSKISGADLSKMAREICDGLRERGFGRQVSFEVEDGVTLPCDAGLMRIVLTNLLENAWKFTAKQRDAKILFGRLQEGGGDIVYVQDNGAGFDMAFSDRLFQPFQRLHSERSFPGTGIGLATVSRIIALHGGKIWAQASPGEGAIFYFQINAQTSDAVQNRSIACDQQNHDVCSMETGRAIARFG